MSLFGMERYFLIMKKNKNLEMRFYELIGIKKFRKAVFKLQWFLTPNKKENNGERLRVFKDASNYNIGKNVNYESIKAFKKQLLFNSTIHSIGIIILIPFFIKDINSLDAIIGYSFAVVFNSYCIMLQRYNWIKSNNVLKFIKPKYEQERQLISSELKKEDALLDKHLYISVNKKQKESIISFDQVIARANMAQLNDYKTALIHMKNYNNYLKENPTAIDEIDDFEEVVTANKNTRLILKFDKNSLKSAD